MKKRGPPAITHRNHPAMTWAAFFYSCLQSLGFGEVPGSSLLITQACAASSLGPHHHLPWLPEAHSGQDLGWCSPCCWLICCLAVPGSAADVGWRESGKTNGGDVDPWSEPGPANMVCQHQAWHRREAIPWQPLPWHWSLASCKLLMRLWGHKKYSSKDNFYHGL